MEKSSKFLKVTGILMIIGGSFAIITCFVFLLFSVIVAFVDNNALREVISSVGSFGIVGFIIALLGGAVQFFTGLSGVKNSKKPEKANVCIILGTITTLFFLTSQLISAFDHGDINLTDIIFVLVGLLLPSIYLISAIRLKTKIDIKEIVLGRKEVIFEIIFTFILCGIIGWAFETVEVWIHYGTLTDRGILFISRINDFPIVWGLPFIMMYGIGGAILIWCFKPLKNEPVKLFFVGTIVLTIFEYVTSVICEYFFDRILWDYSNLFMNFQGRICLTSSLAWGVLSVVSVKLLSPLFHRMYSKIKRVEILHITSIILLIYIFVCYVLRHILFPDMV